MPHLISKQEGGLLKYLSSHRTVTGNRNLRCRELSVEGCQKPGGALGDVDLEDIWRKRQSRLRTRLYGKVRNRNEQRREFKQGWIHDGQTRQWVKRLGRLGGRRARGCCGWSYWE